jgi:hypothetical protein
MSHAPSFEFSVFLCHLERFYRGSVFHRMPVTAPGKTVIYAAPRENIHKMKRANSKLQGMRSLQNSTKGHPGIPGCPSCFMGATPQLVRGLKRSPGSVPVSSISTGSGLAAPVSAPAWTQKKAPCLGDRALKCFRICLPGSRSVAPRGAAGASRRVKIQGGYDVLGPVIVHR